MTALGWSYASTTARIAFQFGAGAILARLLGPQPFGVVATAWALVGTGSQFVDCGFGSALIQRDNVTEEEIRFAFTMQLLAGAALGASAALAATPLSGALGNPSLAPVIRLLALALVLQALGQTANSLLRRSLDFKTQQLAQLAGTILGYGFFAIPMAASGFGAASLIVAQLVQIAVSTALVYSKVRHSLRPLFRTPAKSFLQFGMAATATNVVNWVIAGLDSLVLSRAFGAVQTGLFNRAQTLAITPLAQFVQVIQSVLFPSYSRVAGNTAAIRRVYLAALAVVATVLLPAAAILAVTSMTAVTGLFGEQWSASAHFLVPLALAMPFNAAMALNGPLLWSRDRVGAELMVQVATLACLAALLSAASRYEAPAVAWAVLVASIVRSIGMLARTLPAAGVTWRDCGLVLRGPAVLCVSSGIAAAFLDRSLTAAQVTPGLRMAALAAILIPLTVVFGSLLLPRDIREIIQSFTSAFPKPSLSSRFAWASH